MLNTTANPKPRLTSKLVAQYIGRLPLSARLELNQQVSALFTPVILSVLGRPTATVSNLVCANINQHGAIDVCCANPAIASALKHQQQSLKQRLKQAMLEAVNSSKNTPPALVQIIQDHLHKNLRIVVSPSMQLLAEDSNYPNPLPSTKPVQAGVNQGSISAIQCMGNQVNDEALKAALQGLADTLMGNNKQ